MITEHADGQARREDRRGLRIKRVIHAIWQTASEREPTFSAGPRCLLWTTIAAVAHFNFNRVDLSCIQKMSWFLGEATNSVAFQDAPFRIGGVVRSSRHFLISAWPSAKENPQARL